MRGNLSWLVRWACCADPRDFSSALAALVDPVQNTVLISSPYTISIPFSLSPSKLGTRQAALLGRLSFNMCLWFYKFSQFYRSGGWKIEEKHT